MLPTTFYPNEQKSIDKGLTLAELCTPVCLVKVPAQKTWRHLLRGL